MFFGYIVLLVAFTLSVVAAYYSVLGLVSIFAAAAIPVIVMGGSLEVGKVTAAMWLHKNWTRSPIAYKLYLVPAVIFLMLLTSMGVFGFLSKAHSDQSLVSGDVQAKIAVYDEKIKTSKENIDANRKALKQLDEAVDQVMGRSSDEKGADKAVAIRKGQSKDRVRLQSEIALEQKAIASLNEARAPIAAEVRKVEAEVGPIKYIAALVYGDNPDSNLLEKSVRWVIILIVVVFDPLAIILILAGIRQLAWAREDKLIAMAEAKYPADDGPLTADQIDQIQESVPVPFVKPVEEPVIEEVEEAVVEEPVAEKTMLELHPYLDNVPANRHPPGVEPVGPMVAAPVVAETEVIATEEPAVVHVADEIAVIEDTVQEPVLEEPATIAEEPVPKEMEVIAEPVSFPLYQPADNAADNVEAEPAVVQRLVRREAYDPKQGDELHQVVTMPVADNERTASRAVRAQFGTAFTTDPEKGELFLRVDYFPTQLFKFNGSKWIGIEKSTTDTYSYNEEYINYLVEQIKNGNYDVDDLSSAERDQIEQHLKNAQSTNNPT